MNSSQIIFYSGIGTIGMGILFGVCSLVILKVTGARLEKKLNLEYGAKRHTRRRA